MDTSTSVPGLNCIPGVDLVSESVFVPEIGPCSSSESVFEPSSGTGIMVLSAKPAFVVTVSALPAVNSVHVDHELYVGILLADVLSAALAYELGMFVDAVTDGRGDGVFNVSNVDGVGVTCTVLFIVANEVSCLTTCTIEGVIVS